jgi:hypothetical protein
MTSPPPQALSNNKSKPVETRFLGTGLNLDVCMLQSTAIPYPPRANRIMLYRWLVERLEVYTQVLHKRQKDLLRHCLVAKLAKREQSMTLIISSTA